jgi:cytochrome b561
MTGCVGEIDVLSRLAGLPWSDWALAVHDVMAAIVWIFLIGHGLMAILRHYAGSDDLRAIWSLHPKPETKKRGAQ